jgi:hypothetical protein
LAARLLDETNHRKALSAIKYTSQDHDQNPFRSNDVTASDAQAAFRASQGELVSSIWKWEAQPVRLPWSATTIHRSNCGAIINSLNDQPVLGIGGGDCILLAMKFDQLMLDSEREAATEAVVAAEKRAAALAR